MDRPQLTDPWVLGAVEVPNRVMLAPLAGIGNWFVRLQAKRYGAGMAVSEMISTHAIHHRNRRTCEEMLLIDEREHEGGPVAIQLFGEDPGLMREGAAAVVAAGADAVDINMGCPVPKVRRTGAGVQLLEDPDLAVALAAGAVAGAAGAPVTVKLRSGLRAGDDSGYRLALRLVDEAGVAAIAFHPRSANVHHKGTPDYELAARLARELAAPMILTGGLSSAERVRDAYERTGAAAVMLARGAIGNPWLFEELLAGREHTPGPDEVQRELEWVVARAREAFGTPRADRYLRKFYPWYADRLSLTGAERRALLQSMQSADDAEAALGALRDASLAAA